MARDLEEWEMVQAQQAEDLEELRCSVICLQSGGQARLTVTAPLQARASPPQAGGLCSGVCQWTPRLVTVPSAPSSRHPQCLLEEELSSEISISTEVPPSPPPQVLTPPQDRRCWPNCRRRDKEPPLLSLSSPNPLEELVW